MSVKSKKDDPSYRLPVNNRVPRTPEQIKAWLNSQRGRYFQVPADIGMDLGPLEAFLWGIIHSFEAIPKSKGGKGYCYLSQETLGGFANRDRRAMSDALARLVDTGYVEQVANNQGRRMANWYKTTKKFVIPTGKSDKQLDDGMGLLNDLSKKDGED